MERKISKKLLEWKNSSNHQPLILKGARQVGKTYIVNIFAKNEYQNSVYCNFEKDQNLYDFFDDLSPESIIKNISLYKKEKIFKNTTLIIFDEIQAFPRALTALKYFNEEANDYHIIALGSLLGVSINREQHSFPVGKVQSMTLYPLDFEEYLMAKGEDELLKLINDCYQTNSPMNNAFHKRALDYYKEYLFIGGMPRVVSDYLETNNVNYAHIIQEEILENYQADMTKYNKQVDAGKTQLVYKSISTQLAKENKKFQYKDVKSGGRASEFENAIEWVCLSGIASQNYRLEHIMLPLNANKSLSDFKFYMNDVGLCCALQKMRYEEILDDSSIYSNFKGGLTENYVFNQLKVNNLELYYWTSGSKAEIDFITRIGLDIIPIEVKSNVNTHSKSLNVYINKYNPKYAIRISQRNFGFENGIKSVPLYATYLIKN